MAFVSPIPRKGASSGAPDVCGRRSLVAGALFLFPFLHYLGVQTYICSGAHGLTRAPS